MPGKGDLPCGGGIIAIGGYSCIYFLLFAAGGAILSPAGMNIIKVAVKGSNCG